MLRNRWIVSCFVLWAALAAVPSALALGKLQGYAERGGTPFLTTLTGASSNAQASYPSATITVYLPGTLVKATIYADASLTAKANPFTADSKGYWAFWASDGDYDVAFSGGGITVPWTISGLRVAGGTTTLYNLKTYGCVGDGATDDSACIAAAVSAARASNASSSVIYGPRGSYLHTSTIDLTLNTSTQDGDLVGTRGLTLEGDGAIDTMFICKTGSAPCIDTTGRGHLTLRRFGIKEGSSNKPAVGILQGRSTLGYSVFPQHVRIEDVYIDFLSNDNTANTNNGRVGIYNRDCVETSLYINNQVIADNPLVITKNNVFSVGSALVLTGSASSCAQDTIIGGFYYATGTLSTNGAFILEGTTTMSIRDVTVSKPIAGNGAPTYPFRILADVSGGTNPVYKLVLDNIQIEQFRSVMFLAAPLYDARLHATYTQSNSSTAIIFGSANSELRGCDINILNTDTATAGQLINDNSQAGKILSNAIHLYKPLTVVATASSCLGNTYWYNDTTAPTIACAATDSGLVVFRQEGTRITRLITPFTTIATLTAGTNNNISLTGTANVIITTTAAPFAITGFSIGGAAPSDGMVLDVWNHTGQQMTITNLGAGSSSGFKLYTNTGGDVVLRAGDSSARFVYNASAGIWVLTSFNGT